MKNFGMLRVAAASPRLRVGNPQENLAQMLELLAQADSKHCALLVFPELAITGYTCADLFSQKLLIQKSLDALIALKEASVQHKYPLILVGVPLMIQERLYNCAVALQNGKFCGVVPKTYLPNYREFYEKRWFTSGYEAMKHLETIDLEGEEIPFGRLIFKNRSLGFALGVEICEDLWAPLPPSSYLALHGSNLVANLSASNELVAKAHYRRQLVSQQSARCLCGYVYASAGVHESTTDVVFSGDCLVAENGKILAASKRFSRENLLVYSELDLDILDFERQNNKSFTDAQEMERGGISYRTVNLPEVWQENDQALLEARDTFTRVVGKNPFVPSDQQTFSERCEDIFNIQVTGLAKRLEHTQSRRAVIGVSGGLDSTLALLVARRTMDLLGQDPSRILAITMPGFGTSDGTRHNALELMKALGVTCREIPIKEACLQHFQDIGHDPGLHDVTYENVQARERTQILMDLANKEQGLVVGTGDLSELALGWSTYNGDHMSMYAVNSGVPKTLVKFLVQWVADHVYTGHTAEILKKVIATPISPELLPLDAQGAIQQKTEDLIGPYELHDFFLFYVVRFGMEPRKVLFLAELAFGKLYSSLELKKWLKLFYQRFFVSQFKRSCLPDGPKVGSVSLSPRSDWRMPSDADVTLWLQELE